MQNTNEPTTRTDGAPAPNGQGWVGPELPSLSGILIGSVLFSTGGMLMFTVVGIPPGILLFAAGLGLMLEPKRRPPR